MTPRDRICITVHVAYITGARYHFAIYSYKGFVFFCYICKEKREYKTVYVIYPPQLSVCGLKVKVNLQGTFKKMYREKLEAQGPCTGHRSSIAILYCFSFKYMKREKGRDQTQYTNLCGLNTLPH